MKITFNGQVLGVEPPQGGTDTIQGFILDEAKQEVQWVRPLRANDATPIARGNRQRSLSGIIIPSQAPTLDSAMAARTTLYDGLPMTGELVLQEGIITTTWATAILQAYRTLKDYKGVSFAFELVFLPQGAGVLAGGSAPTLGTESGGVVGLES